MGYNDHVEDFRPELPPEAGVNGSSGFEPNDEWLKTADEQMCCEAMRVWFSTRFCDPANDTPYISSEGGYQYINGGPFDAENELYGRFGKIFDDELIRQVIDDIESEGVCEWAPIHTDSDYDSDFDFEVPERNMPYQFFRQYLSKSDLLKDLETSNECQPFLYQLLYSSMITALEAYLSETMLFWVKANEQIYHRFVGSCEEFKQQKFLVSDIFNRFDTLQKDVEVNLQKTIWHRLDKVLPLFAESFAIETPPKDKLMKHIKVRHDIVHRGGKAKDGGLVVITREKLDGLRNAIITFIDEIEDKLKVRFPIGNAGRTTFDTEGHF